jgi:hypothetical protein
MLKRRIPMMTGLTPDVGLWVVALPLAAKG